MRQQPGLVVVGGAVLVLAIAAACGSDAEGDGSSSGSSGTSSGSSGILGSSGGAGEGGTGEGGTSGNCNAPVDMYIMFDRSSSMGDDGNIGRTNSKWTRAVTALSGYFNSPSAKDQGAAIQFFPLQNHSDARCETGDGYEVAASPANPPGYTTLPSNGFDQLLNDSDPAPQGSGTPTEAAIRGLSRFTAANRRGGRVTIGILITDGQPRECNEDRPFLADLLSKHHTATQIRTYVIGMEGANFDQLEEIAAGGGSPEHPDAVGSVTDACGGAKAPCHHWNVGDGNPAAFVAALEAIQASADGCNPGGGTINVVK